MFEATTSYPTDKRELYATLEEQARGLLHSELLGVLDLDSPELARFDAVDQAGLERVASVFLASIG